MTRATKAVLTYFIAVIGVPLFVFVVAVPSFVKSANTSQLNACLNNQRSIDSGKEQWALAVNRTAGDRTDIAGVNEYLKGNTTPTCSTGGRYFYDRIGTEPRCSIHGSLSEHQEWAKGSRTGTLSGRDLHDWVVAIIILAIPAMLLAVIPVTIYRTIRAGPHPDTDHAVPGVVLVLGFLFIGVGLFREFRGDVWQDSFYRHDLLCARIVRYMDAVKRDFARQHGLSATTPNPPLVEKRYCQLVSECEVASDLRCPENGTYMTGGPLDPVCCSRHGRPGEPDARVFWYWIWRAVLKFAMAFSACVIVLVLVARRVRTTGEEI